MTAETGPGALPVLETERLRLRAWRPDDAPRFLDTYRRWEVARWLGAEPRALEDLDEAQARIARWAGLAAEHPGQGLWAVERRDTGSVAGTALLVRLPDGDGELEVGWHLHPDSWGHGFATEAAARLLTWTFGNGTSEAFAVVRPGNVASVAVCRRLGMDSLGRSDRYYGTELELFRTDPLVHARLTSAR